MNEITKVHLGRQAFTISIDAYHDLRAYLDAIKKQVADKEVVDEVELRMAELLTEHGIDANKVILSADVDFLKKQLGSPAEFKEDEDDSDTITPQAYEGKRLFRDTDHAMVAGVAAGLASYSGIDVLLVRIVITLLTILTGGWVILLYVLLWVLVPEAKTPSDRLQMAGKRVTIYNLKESISQADVKGVAHRANATIAGPINTIFRLILKLVGLAFVLFGLTALFALIGGAIYFTANSAVWLQNNIFPLGFREHLVLYIAVAVVALIAVFGVLIGIAIFRRKWPIPSWVTGVLVGLVFIGLATGGALSADVYPNVRDSYNANTHTTARSVAPFTAVDATGDGVDSINYAVSDKYYVTFNYYGQPNLGSIKTSVSKGTLLIDTSQFSWKRNCSIICIPKSYNMVITVYTPNAIQLENQQVNYFPAPPSPTPMYKPY